jgi:hypothetical protein
MFTIYTQEDEHSVVLTIHSVVAVALDEEDELRLRALERRKVEELTWRRES